MASLKVHLPYHSCRKWILLSFGVLFFFTTNAQQQNNEPTGKYSKITKYDTNYMYKFDAALSLGPTLSYRNFNIVLKPKIPVDCTYISDLKWRSPSKRFWGIDFNYDKFGFTMSFAGVEPKADRDKKGESSSKSFGFSYGGNRCFLEANFMTFKGFYEANSALQDTSLDTYYQSPNLTSSMLNLKVWYLTNHHKFAFKSCYGGLYRQLKTQASFAFSSNLHLNSIIADSSIVPDPDRQYFDNALQVRVIDCGGLSIMAGGAINFVIRKKFFINLGWVLGPDFQALTMATEESTYNKSYTSFTQDFRFASGLNAHRWYFTFTAKHETNRFVNELLDSRIRLNSFSLNLGYRLDMKTPKLYSKFQKTWLYSVF